MVLYYVTLHVGTFTYLSFLVSWFLSRLVSLEIGNRDWINHTKKKVEKKGIYFLPLPFYKIIKGHVLYCMYVQRNMT